MVDKQLLLNVTALATTLSHRGQDSLSKAEPWRPARRTQLVLLLALCQVTLMEVFDGIWNLDWESSAILKRLILPAILCCFVLCNLLCALFHLFYKKHCDKGSDVCKFLLFLLAGTNQVTNCISTSVLFSVFSVLDDRYISCAIVNFEFFASILQLNTYLLFVTDTTDMSV